ncbi:unnamed protein product [Spirodela intermedia]|uniref:Uncharacterized protein n=1 Tax=Spirodela intermedia TaxID=51605 RepID=A0A7I8IHK6_SPIIN|nr:unnamed protein product [Spirodela intermedia]CAA6656332.1 unnamed protein product [Spirodela intermedia]
MGRPVWGGGAGGEEAAVEVRERERERREDVDVTALGLWGRGLPYKGLLWKRCRAPGSIPAYSSEGGSGAAWTDEKHTSFLNCLEDSFVRWMMMGGRLGSGVTRPDAEPLRLDRHMPDGEDSTRDCRSRRAGAREQWRATAMVGQVGSGACDIVESHGKTRKRWHRRQADPQLQEDQVVPRYEGTTSEENGRPNPTDARLSPQLMTGDRRRIERRHLALLSQKQLVLYMRSRRVVGPSSGRISCSRREP